jgi:hypothetical protein
MASIRFGQLLDCCNRLRARNSFCWTPFIARSCGLSADFPSIIEGVQRVIEHPTDSVIAEPLPPRRHVTSFRCVTLGEFLAQGFL